MKRKLSPSIMCADFMRLKDCLACFERQQVELIHVDIMDGRFVPNYTLGVDFCRILKENTKIPLDLHLMIEKPEEKLGWFSIGEGDYVSVHYESTPHICRALQQIRAKGAKAVVALNPGTPVSALENLLEEMDALLIMTVNPGFAGQKLIAPMLDKIADARAYLDRRGYGAVEIEADGNVSFENAVKMSAGGANILVGGTSSVFCPGAAIDENIRRLRSSLAAARPEIKRAGT